MRKIFSLILGLLWALPAFAVLPSGYTQLEYIESTGRQYIDTGVGLNAANKITGKVSFVTLNTLSYIAGGRLSSGAAVGYALYGASHSGFTIYNTTWPEQGIYVSANQILEFETVMKSGQQSFIVNGNTIVTGDRTISLDSNNIYLFGLKTEYMAAAKVYSLKIYNNNTLVRDFVPAKDADGVVGMYDTVNNRFYTNAGTGEFIAGDPVNTCRNLFDANSTRYTTSWTSSGSMTAINPDSVAQTYGFAVTPGKTYTISKTGGNRLMIGGFSSVEIPTRPLAAEYQITLTLDDSLTQYTFTAPNGCVWILFSVKNNEPTVSDATNIQIEQGDTATDYVPYNPTCWGIKIASTKYVESQFSDLSTRLAAAVATVNTVVTNTINQAASIATLQAQKQTRPNDIADDNEKCPAGKKCLLVEDASGVPHWYEIVENAYGLPSGYTALEYIQSDGASYLIVPYRVNNKTVFYCRYNEIQDGPQTANAVFGVTTLPDVSKANNGILRLTGSNYNRMGWGDSVEGSVITVNARKEFNTWYEVLYDQNKLYQNDRLYATSATQPNVSWVAEYDLGIFARNSTSVTMPAIAKISSVWAKENGEYKINLIPVKRNSDGVIGMFDTVSGEFFTNKGSGSFIAGDPVSE